MKAVVGVILWAAGVNAICSNAGYLLQSLTVSNVLSPTDDNYTAAAMDGYAASSFPERFSPSYIVQVARSEDVPTALAIARWCGMRVAIKSGGHSYVGLSSCDSSLGPCMQLDMGRLNSVSWEGDRLTVGPGVRLGDLYAVLNDAGRFLPAGMCPAVAVGGHMNTGGMGLLSRAYGAFIDHVVAFNITLWSGKEVHVYRPETDDLGSSGSSESGSASGSGSESGSGSSDSSGSGGDELTNRELYWAVLGGAPGALGVVTSLTLLPLRDDAHSNSAIHTCTWAIGPDGLRAMRALLHAVAEEYANPAVANDVNQFLTVQVFGPILRFDGVWAAVGNKPYDGSAIDRVIAKGVAMAPAQCTLRHIPLSFMTRYVTTVPTAREFPLPFANRGSYALKPHVTPAFADAVADSLTEFFANASTNSGMYVTYQVAPMGGTLTANAGLTGMPLRDHNVLFGGAVFYDPRFRSQDAARAVWDRIIDIPFQRTPELSYDTPHRWMLGPSGFTYEDMAPEKSAHEYYPSEAYQKVRSIKTKVDPDNIFSTPMTPLPF
eukprot:TRINITY_DN6235_c2_g1_i1.p1 TRINITY_DN6235_c2_g1~~TRINITY_DN6235_c2_g1_i1.p1  ORF type:complete len:547 (+),score=143.60 TRINITY_DN6235_c2_g1_i1:72-1712(+)